jgi:NAD(P) transhydrogenase subunit alpha
VIVDLAAEQGGNCAMTEPGEVVAHKGVSVIGYTDLPSRMASLSSQLYSATIVALLEELRAEDGSLTVNLEDQVQRGALVAHEGKITYRRQHRRPRPNPELRHTARQTT